MAAIGARYPLFAPFSGEEPEAALPKYGEKVVLGKLVKADVTITNAKGELYADDVLAESVEEFASGTVAMETDDMTLEVGKVIYGATLDEEEKTLTNKGDDVIPYGGLTYVKNIRRKGVPVFKGYFFPKVKASIGNDNAATKGSAITFGTTPVTFTVFQSNEGTWRQMAEFATFAEAKAWCEGKFTAGVGG